MSHSRSASPSQPAFPGFPERIRYTAIPSAFFSALLPHIDDLAELKAILLVFWALQGKRGALRFATYRELLAQSPDAEALRAGLDRATERGTFLRLAVDTDGVMEELYFLNTEANRQAVARLRKGELAVAGGLPGEEATPVEPRLSVFKLYEDNIGLITPLIAEELKEAEGRYPPSWLEDAFKEAVALNHRSWRYIARILERWAAEGREHGEPKGRPQADPDKYIKGRYGHLVKRG